jgi:cytoskeletal protein CcmA (bactofilin family)
MKDTRASIGRTTRIVGRLSGDGDLLVEGRVEGELSLKGHVTVADGGVVVAPLTAGDVTVEGLVDGDVSSRGAVTLRASGAIRGAITAARVAVDEGARFTGRIEMDVELPPELGGSESTRAPERASRKRG